MAKGLNNKNSLFNLVSPFQPDGDQPQAIAQLIEGFQDKRGQQQVLLGVTGSGKTFTMANIISQLGKKTLILAHNKTLAAQLYEEFKEFFPNNAVEYFVSYYDYYQPEAYIPGSDTYIEKDSSINDEIDKLRHSATQSLLERDDVIVVSSVSCIYGIGSPDEYESQKLFLYPGIKFDRDDFLRLLLTMQFERNETDFHRGCFRVKGDIVDVFPVHEDSQIIRLEFLDDEIEKIFLVDPLLQKMKAELNKVTLYPRSHYVVSEARLKTAMETIRVELRERLIELKGQGKLVEHQRLEQRTMLDLEMMEEMGFCSGIENYSRHLTGVAPGEPPPTLIDFFKKDFLMIIDESHMTLPQVGGMYRGDRARKTNLVEHGFRLPSALDNRPLNFEEFERKLDNVLYVSATPAEYELKKCRGEVVEQVIRPTGLVDPMIEVRPAVNQVEDFYKEINLAIKKGHKILATTLTKKLAEDLTSYYQGLGLKVRYLHSEIDTLERIEILHSLRQGEFDILVGINLLREGLDLPEVALVGIFDADKEGFLRSDRALIQTIGRAARNVEGRVVMYAHKITDSMKRAMAETDRRRNKQLEYNQLHGKTATTIQKSLKGGVIETLRGKGSSSSGNKTKVKSKEKSKEQISLQDIENKIRMLRFEMQKASKELRFEEAAKIRDEIKKLSEVRMFL
jgi:excinuclease ABC subunit B